MVYTGTLCTQYLSVQSFYTVIIVQKHSLHVVHTNIESRSLTIIKHILSPLISLLTKYLQQLTVTYVNIHIVRKCTSYTYFLMNNSKNRTRSLITTILYSTFWCAASSHLGCCQIHKSGQMTKYNQTNIPIIFIYFCSFQFSLKIC